MKYGSKPVKGFRSNLEYYTWGALTAAGLTFAYEPVSIELVPPCNYPNVSYGRRGKKFVDSPKTRAVSYKPDFVGIGWIIETKGMQTPDFIIKWKLFKNLLVEKNAPYALYMPTNKKEVDWVIQDILTKRGNYQELFQDESNVQLNLGTLSKPKTDEINAGRKSRRRV